MRISYFSNHIFVAQQNVMATKVKEAGITSEENTEKQQLVSKETEEETEVAKDHIEEKIPKETDSKSRLGYLTHT